MRVFVTGTGRCGTVTFAKACSHISNFTSGHETRTRHPELVYPDNHIEVDPHLVWRLDELIKKYPDAYYAFLYREPHLVKASMARRPSMRTWGQFAFMNGKIPPAVAAKSLHDSAIAIMSHHKQRVQNAFTAMTPVLGHVWNGFCTWIGAEGDVYEPGLAELRKKYNASRK